GRRRLPPRQELAAADGARPGKKRGGTCSLAVEGAHRCWAERIGLCGCRTETVHLVGSPVGGGSHLSRVPQRAYPAGLTTREVEVLRLVAAGLTDAQVAEQLVISLRTVNSHLTSIYNKLGVNSRASATRFAVERHLV